MINIFFSFFSDFELFDTRNSQKNSDQADNAGQVHDVNQTLYIVVKESSTDVNGGINKFASCIELNTV